MNSTNPTNNDRVTELTEERDSVYLREILKTNRKPLPVQTLLIEEKNAKPMADFAGLSLEGKDCSLHAAMEETPSDVTLVAFHFSQATMETANMFVDDFFTEFKDNPRVSTYQFSFLSGVWRLPMLRKLLTQWTGKVCKLGMSSDGVVSSRICFCVCVVRLFNLDCLETSRYVLRALSGLWLHHTFCTTPLDQSYMHPPFVHPTIHGPFIHSFIPGLSCRAP